MSTNVILFGWERPSRGREEESANHFNDFNQYLTAQSESGGIKSYQVVFLDNHGGDLNGFFLIHGSNEQLNSLVESQDWKKNVMRASLHLDKFGVVSGATNELVLERMALWNDHRPA
ncbi:MAG: hypothetical protein R2747_04065 [Pyrinomonadaceae bacterium]